MCLLGAEQLQVHRAEQDWKKLQLHHWVEQTCLKASGYKEGVSDQGNSGWKSREDRESY